MSFNNRVVWITGASSGIGEALAQAFHAQGAKLVLSSRREAELERVKADLKASGDDVLVLPLDLEKPESLPEKADAVLKHFGRIDILVNNGGISQRALAKETQLDVDERIMKINYFGTIALTRATLPTMLKQKSGHVVTISSLAGKIGTPMRSAYCASKHALHGFFDSLRAETAHDGIKVTLICPGYISTNVSVNALTGDGDLYMKMDQAVANGLAPSECAERILRAIERGKEEIVVGTLSEKLVPYIKTLMPRRFSRMMRKAAPK